VFKSCVLCCENDFAGGRIWLLAVKSLIDNVHNYIFVRSPSQSYRTSPAVWDHTLLFATWHRWTCPTLNLSRHAGTRFTYPWGMEGWVDLGFAYLPRSFTCLQTVTGSWTHDLLIISLTPYSYVTNPSWSIAIVVDFCCFAVREQQRWWWRRKIWMFCAPRACIESWTNSSLFQ